ncbi:MAG: hypothetical protein M1833_006256 [Piccolia ochrophora]|nr:MAG: hypothetical protein M1833_006256 [Piccolia ochrophora]
MVLSKDQLEAQLHAEKRDISDGRLKEDSPLDLSDAFRKFCEACRQGDLKTCQQYISGGVNINACDEFDYTPLILASLCGHYETVQLLLEAGALCERDTFQGERCLYNALNDRIRNLLLQYDYSKSSDPLQPLASHVTSLLSRDHPRTSDIIIAASAESFPLHKFILSAKSPYFQKKLAAAPETTLWKLPSTIPTASFEVVTRYVYFGEVSVDLVAGYAQPGKEQEILNGIGKLSRHLEIGELWEGLLEAGDRRIARQRRNDEMAKGTARMATWYKNNVLKHKVRIESSKADDVRWDRSNAIFADVLLRTDDDMEEEEEAPVGDRPSRNTTGPLNGIPVGPIAHPSRSPSRSRRPRHSTLFPVHRAMLLRSEFFLAMFSSNFREAQHTEHLQIVPIDCSPDVMEVVLTFLYTEKAEFPLEMAIDVLFAADLLLIEKLKIKAAIVISTLGNGSMAQQSSAPSSGTSVGEPKHQLDEPVDIYDVIRAAWLTRVRRLEEFGARFLAYRLESHIDEAEFADLIRESASRIQKRQETDSIELLDEYAAQATLEISSCWLQRLTVARSSIRWYLSERFRLRFEDSGLEELMDETDDQHPVQDGQTAIDHTADQRPVDDEGVDLGPDRSPSKETMAGSEAAAQGLGLSGAVRTLDGELAGDEFASDAINYQVLLGKIDGLLERLDLDA